MYTPNGTMGWSRSANDDAPPIPACAVAVFALRLAGVTLARLARRFVTRTQARTATPVLLEFDSESGAPEGALYVDGKLFGWLPGVQRL